MFRRYEDKRTTRRAGVAFLILTILGGLMLAAATLFDYTHAGQTAVLSGFPLGAIVCLFCASLNHAKYLTLRYVRPPAETELK